VSEYTYECMHYKDDTTPMTAYIHIHRSATYFRNWDLAVEGSPTTHTLMSPLRFDPSAVVLCTPPNSCSSTPRLISSCPKMLGATDLTIFLYKCGVDLIAMIRRFSSSVKSS
jgi:hypothetical protein